MAAFCLNLCETANRAVIKEEYLQRIIECVVLNNNIQEPLERIYAGSSFCSQYFLHINFWKHLIKRCEENGWKMTLTLPVFSQKDLQIAKNRLDEILAQGKEIIDEITVNDVGMLRYVSQNCEQKINLGRLFFKDSRDVRVRPYDVGEMTPTLLASEDNMIMAENNIHAIELDMMSRYINLTDCDLGEAKLCVHGPFCYMSTGNICKFASIHKDMEQKFRPNLNCNMECAGIYEHYKARFGEKNVDILRYGRTIYFYNNESRIIGKKIDRKIYFPVREINEVMKGGVSGESTRTIK